MKRKYIALLLMLTLCVACEARGQGSWSVDSSDGFTQRVGPASCALGGKIYVLGGDEYPYFDGVTNIMEVFDPKTHIWSSATGMPTGRYNLSCSTINGKIYAIGGEPGGSGTTSALSIFEIFDSATALWSTGDTMPTARSEHTSSIVEDKLY